MKYFQKWLENQRKSCDMKVKEIPWSYSREWLVNTKSFQHKSGKFYKIVGVNVYLNNQLQSHLSQPLIDQWEIGILGFIIRENKVGIEALVQAKPEPGNIGFVQAAPTVQATESNYKKVHQGKETPFLDYFLDTKKAISISDSLQSEQGTKFLRKYNRNVVVEIRENTFLCIPKAYKWVPVLDLLPLLIQDFQINTDARSVLATSTWSRLVNNKPFSRWQNQNGFGNDLLHSYLIQKKDFCLSTQEILDRLSSYRLAHKFVTKVVRLVDLPYWKMTDNALQSTKAKNFEIRQFQVNSSEREVVGWDQPLVISRNMGIVILYAQKINGILHFLFNCRAEIGFQEGFQYGPTIEEGDSEAIIFSELYEQEYKLKEYLKKSQMLLSNLHSDEGGRFYQCVFRYSIYLLDKKVEVNLGENLSWINLKQIELLIKNQGLFSNEARTLISMLLAYL